MCAVHNVHQKPVHKVGFFLHSVAERWHVSHYSQLPVKCFIVLEAVPRISQSNWKTTLKKMERQKL